MNDKKHIKCISEYKELNVVGNATSLFDKDYGSLIDKCLTIRFNYIENLVPEKQGSRWDIMATSNPRELNKWRKLSEVPFHTLLFTTWAEREKRHMPKGNFKGANVCEIDDTIWKELVSIHPSRPSTGMLVLYACHKLNIEKVNIFGFDHKETKTYYNDNETDKKESKMHNYNFERDCLTQILNEHTLWKIYK